MGRHGLSSSWRLLGYPTGGTHQGRLIDYVWATIGSIRPTSQQVLGRYGSDHSAVAVTLTSRAATATRPAQTDTLQTGTTTRTGGLPATITVPGADPGTTTTLTGQQVTNAAVVIAEGKAHRIPA